VIAGRFVEPVPTPTLLTAAANAVVVELRRENNARPVIDADAWFTGDSAASWDRFAERYCQAWESKGDNVAPEALAYPAIRAMTAAVHEAHTGFLTPEMYREHLAWTSTGDLRYDGIGIRLRPEPLRVDYVFAGGPAEAAGLRAGDEIIAIDGTAASEMTAAGASVALRGDAGSHVR